MDLVGEYEEAVFYNSARDRKLTICFIEAGTSKKEALSVYIENEVGDITVRGGAGTIKTASGDISCGDVGGSVSTMNGDVDCGNVGGSVSTMNGDISRR